jgi:hypothetical protein
MNWRNNQEFVPTGVWSADQGLIESINAVIFPGNSTTPPSDVVQETVIILGLIVHVEEPEAAQWISSIRFAVDTINNEQSLLPNHTFKLVLADDRNDKGTALFQALLFPSKVVKE